MEKKDVFEQLAEDLPDDERIEMLNEIKEDLKKHQKTEKKDEEITQEKEEENVFLEKQYSSAGILEKIQLFILKLLTGKSIYILIKEKNIKNIGKEIEHEYPGLIDTKESKIKEQFYNELNILKSSALDLYEIFTLINQKGTARFYQFIAAAEMSDIEDTLKKNTDPDFIFRRGEITEREKIKNEINRQYHDIVESIDTAEKDKVYTLIRGFYLIQHIVEYRFDLLMKNFGYEPNGNKFCSFGNCRKHLKELYDLIHSIHKTEVSYSKIIKYMVEYYNINNEAPALSRPDENNAKMIKKITNDFENIKVFEKNVPLKKVLKYLYKDLNYKASMISGGEEWFTVYKNYLKEQVDRRYDSFLIELKKNDIVKKMRYYIDDLPDENRLNFSFEIRDKVYNFPYAVMFFYLKCFYNTFFIKKVDRIVSRLLLDGIFYKDTNRKELYEAYNNAGRIEEEFAVFLDKINPENEEIKKTMKYNFEETSIKLLRKRTERFIEEINKYLYETYNSYYDSFSTICDVMYGIVNGEVGGKYDTLSNSSELCVERTYMSMTSIQMISANFKEILKMFRDFQELHIGLQ